MVKLLRDLPCNCTVSEIAELCYDLEEQGYKVVIEHKGGRILLYDQQADSDAISKLKLLHNHLVNDVPAPDSEQWDEYVQTMQEIEAQLRDAGVEV